MPSNRRRLARHPPFALRPVFWEGVRRDRIPENDQPELGPSTFRDDLLTNSRVYRPDIQRNPVRAEPRQRKCHMLYVTACSAGNDSDPFVANVSVQILPIGQVHCLATLLHKGSLVNRI